jgi:hypothetical protein
MNYFQKKLEEKKEYQHKKPSDKIHDLKKTKMNKMQKTKKNAQLGMF